MLSNYERFRGQEMLIRRFNELRNETVNNSPAGDGADGTGNYHDAAYNLATQLMRTFDLLHGPANQNLDNNDNHHGLAASLNNVDLLLPTPRFQEDLDVRKNTLLSHYDCNSDEHMI